MSDTTKPIPTLRDLRLRRDEILRLAEKHNAFNVRVVGSVARGEADADSDIDLLMTLPPKRSVFDLVSLWLDMQELLGHAVSIIPDSSADEAFMQSILKDAVSL
jgi:predicted nucleotidyltransferase